MKKKEEAHVNPEKETSSPVEAKPTPAPAGNAAPIKKEEIHPLDKICQIISADDEKMLAKIQKEIESLRKVVNERDEYLKLLQRVQADFTNYQKRIKNEKECWDKYQDESILRELIPALENLDRPLKIKCQTDEAKCILDGVELTRREIARILEKRGIKQIKSKGEKFDPSMHEAVGMIESADHPEGTILEELRTGYMLHDRVIRAAQVRISTKPHQATQQNKPPEVKS